MRICANALLIEPGVTGGGEIFLTNLLKKLSRVDTTNDYLILVTDENSHLFRQDEYRFILKRIIGSSRSKALRLLFENLILPFYLLWHRIDLYYSPFGSLPLFLFCRSAVTFQNLIYLDFKRNVPYRGRSLRSYVTLNLQALYYKLITPLTLKRADKIWAVSQVTADLLKRHYHVDESKLEVIYEGVEFEKFHPSRDYYGRSIPFPFPYIITIASLYPNKNIDQIIRAFTLVVKRHFPHKLVIVGRDWHNYREVLEQQVKACHLDDRVIFTGAVDHNLIPSYLWGADLFLLMSNVESFGLPILEAMAAGVPVIVSDRSSLPEIAGNAALTGSVDGHSQLADQMIRVLSDKALSSRLKRRGVDRARRFDWNETAARAVDLFNRAGASRKRVLDVNSK